MRFANRWNVHPQIPSVSLLGLVLVACSSLSEVSIEHDAAVLEAGADGVEPNAPSPDDPSAPDAAAPLDAETRSPDATVSPDAETSSPDAEVSPDAETHPANRLPEAPASFRIALSGSACFGDCPTYSASLNAEGQVTFVGKQCVARPGVYRKKISTGQARAFYDQLRNTAYASLNERYTAQTDCPRGVATDGPTSRWRVEADDSSRPLAYDKGCEGVPELDALGALEPVFQSTAEILAWLKPAPFNCGWRPVPAQIGTYRLSQNGIPLGILTLKNRSFEFLDCKGQNRSQGEIVSDALAFELGRWVLLGENESSIKLSEALGELGAILIEADSRPDANPPTTARGLRENDEIALELKLDAPCAN